MNMNANNEVQGINYKKLSEAQTLNALTFDQIYNRLRSLAISMYEWKGLPKTCNFRFLEKALFDFGVAAFCNDPEYGYITLRSTLGGNLNIYGEPKEWLCYGFGQDGYRSTFPAWFEDMDVETGEYNKDGYVCVPIRNNIDMIPTDINIRLYAYRLTSILRTRDVNIEAQKTPFIGVGTQTQIDTIKAVQKKIKDNELFLGVMSKDSLNIDEALKIYKTQAPFVAGELTDLYHDQWNEALTYLGINNANTDKRERLNVSEVESNDQHINMSANSFLVTRQEAAKQINETFTLKEEITVEMREFSADEIAAPFVGKKSTPDEKEDGENE